MPTLQIKNLTKKISGRIILKDISFRFESGHRYLLVGANGSGKTTFLKILAGLMRPSSGQIHYNERPIEDWNSTYFKHVSLLSHSLYMYEDLSGLENIELFARLHKIENPRERALELLNKVGLKFFVHEKVKYYSRGMKQRLAVAKSLLHNPKILLFDEPFSGLDLRGTELLQESLKELTEDSDGIFILATHNPDLGWKLADSYLYLERGELLSSGDRTKFEEEQIISKLKQKIDVGVF